MVDTLNRPLRRKLGFLSLAGLLLAAISGCVGLESFTNTHSAEPPLPPPLPVNEVMQWWDRSLRFAQDPLHGGTLLPGLAGRVYLINENLKDMVEAGGSIHVAIRNTTPGASPNEPYFAVKCEFKELDLQRLKRKDMVGTGYTLFVPWETYRPDIKQVEVQVCYAPRGGTHQYSSPMSLTILGENNFTIERRQQVYGPGQPPPQQTFGPVPQPSGPGPAPQPQVFMPGQAPQPQVFTPGQAPQPQVFVPGQAPR